MSDKRLGSGPHRDVARSGVRRFARGVGWVRPGPAAVDALPSVRMEDRHAARPRARVPLAGGARPGGPARRRAPTRAGEQRAIRPLPRVDAVPQLWRALGERAGGAGARGPRQRAGAAGPRQAARAEESGTAPDHAARVPPQGDGAARPHPGIAWRRVASAQLQAQELRAAHPEGGSDGALRARPGGEFFRGVQPSYARARDADAQPAPVRDHRASLRGGRVVRLRVLQRPSGGGRLRAALGRRGGGDVGVGRCVRPGAPPQRPAVLGLHRACGPRGTANLQLRALHPRLRPA